MIMEGNNEDEFYDLRPGYYPGMEMNPGHSTILRYTATDPDQVGELYDDVSDTFIVIPACDGRVLKDLWSMRTTEMVQHEAARRVVVPQHHSGLTDREELDLAIAAFEAAIGEPPAHRGYGLRTRVSLTPWQWGWEEVYGKMFTSADEKERHLLAHVPPPKVDILSSRIADQLQSRNCLICSIPSEYATLTPEGFVRRNTLAGEDTYLKVLDLRFSDLVLVPVRSGFNFSERAFKWFGRALAQISPFMSRQSDLTQSASVTVLELAQRARDAVELVDASEDDFLKVIRLPNAWPTLIDKGNIVTKVSVWAIHRYVAFAVAEPRPVRGRWDVRNFYKPRSHRRGTEKRIAVEKLPNKIRPCNKCMRRFLNDSGGLLGLALRTGLPVPRVRVPIDFYEDLLETVCDAVEAKRLTVIVLEADCS